MSRLAAFVAVLVLCGGHMATLQVVAWTGMVVSYSARDGFVAGVKILSMATILVRCVRQ